MIIGVSSFGCTGSSAVYDLLTEYEEIKYPQSGRECEFTLPYSSSGLRMLEFALCEFPVKHTHGDTAICRFLDLVKTLEKTLNRETNGAFTSITKDYLSKIIQVEYKSLKLTGFNGNRLKWITTKASRIIERRLRKITKKPLQIAKRTERFISVHPESFIENTKNYVMNIIAAMGKNESEYFLLDQPFPPNYPEDVFQYFEDPKAIIVERDPRDIYVIAKQMHFASWEFIPHDSVEDFIVYFKATRIHPDAEDGSRVLRVRFEDFIYEYDESVRNLELFLGISKHNSIKKSFRPEVSIKNTQVYRAYPEYADDIAKIEKELSEYLYPFEKYYRDVQASEIIKNGKYI